MSSDHAFGTPSWTPASWRTYPVQQQPNWPDPAAHEAVLKELSGRPPLVFAGEIRTLRDRLAEVCSGESFLLQGGDCVETFETFTADNIRDKLKVLLQMAIVLTYGSRKPVLKVGRIAGQFAKPRSSETETVGGVTLESYRGPAANALPFEAGARTPDPSRLLRVCEQSASTLNLMRAFTRGGFANLRQVHSWNQDFVRASPQGHRYEQVATEIDHALAFARACGIETSPATSEAEIFTSHDALFLGYEEAFTRVDSLTGAHYNVSTHFPWIGERTRNPDGAHVHYFSGIGNPVGCKIGPETTPAEIDALAERLNPDNVPGRLTFITRMGHQLIADRLPPLVQHVRNKGHRVIWSCDPMHGNTFTSSAGLKTRRWDDIMAEVRSFFAIHQQEGTYAGGVHIELTGEQVTECLGGARGIAESDLKSRYETACDPRLNNEQALELAFCLAEMLRG
ncbi:class II 3-deoxy-7-phosphoheptulonate synthase [Streptomyces sp. NPDC046631]|uniref:class II 3-deoxy-7-phosphoheptulonate synthase n=1 Tax=unclassified Streptomyces TaxID=2593676 RepID=UPI0033C4A8CF